MKPMTRRVVTAEFMDDPEIAPEELERHLRYLRFINRRLGGAAAVIGHLKRQSPGWAADETIRIIDIGTGGADIPLAVAEWATRIAPSVQITAVDVHQKTLAHARRAVEGRGEIRIARCDARGLMDRYGPGAFDYALASMVLHHLPDIEVLTVMRIMDRLAARGVIISDLARDAVTKLGARLSMLGAGRILRHDALASARAGFTKREILQLARRVGLRRPEYRRQWWYRFTLVSGT